jgi:hypothetical protein
MRWVATILLLIAVALPAAAQTVTLRSGEHATFSRLVLDIMPGTEWRLGRMAEGYALDLGTGVAYDLTGAFDRIPRDRVAGLAAPDGTGRLVLQVGCECHATAFLFRSDKLVIDVVDGAPPPGSPFELAADATFATPQMAAGSVLPLIAPVRGESDLLFDPPSAPVRAVADMGFAGLDALATDMSRAVAAGLLDPPPVLAASPPAVMPLPADPGSGVQADGPGVNFITADRMQTSPGPRDLSRSGNACRSDAEVDLAAWSPTGEFSRDLGALRGRIVDGAGAVDADAVLALARGYLHHGFGAEALRTLAIGDRDSTEARFLGLLAALIDGQQVLPGVLSDQAGCLGAIALWSTLAEGTLAGRDAAERTAVETAVRVLPPGPRQAVVPRIAAMFLDAGQTRTAEELLALVPRHPDEAVLLLRSDIARATADAAAARSELLAAIDDGSRTGAGTMVRLIEATLDADQPVEAWMIETLAALRFEQGDGPMAGPLALAEVRALTAADRFAEARALIDDPAIALDPDDRGGLSDALATAMAERAIDAAFLDLAFAGAPLPMSGTAANAVARRLIGLGFPEAALDLIDRPAETAAMRDRRLLRADALRALGQEEEAALILAGMAEGEEVVPDPLAAWRAGDWNALRNGADQLLSDAAEARLADPPEAAQDGTLAARAALLASAEETRALADALLARFPAPLLPGPAP